MSEIYITSKFIGQKSLESNSEEDFGYDYETHENFHILGDEPYMKSDSGLIKINLLITELEKMKNEGANYVGCDWHIDHQELDLYGFKLSTSNPNEIENELKSIQNLKREKKEQDIDELEKKLKLLKKDL